MSGSKVVITGGRGFIGVNLFDKLAKSNEVLVFDSLKRSSPTGWNGTDNDILIADLADTELLNQSFTGRDGAIHLAAYGSVIESIADPLTNFSANAVGVLNALIAARDNSVKKFIFASTGGALIGNATPPVNEESLPKPISPYGASKHCGETYCHAFSESYGISTVCLRFGNVYGPHSAHKKGAVTLFIKALIKDEPIIIYGDGSASRDYIFVDDLCDGITAAMESKTSGAEVFHLATGIETTIHELALLLCDIAGKKNHPIVFKDARKGEVNRNCADFTKAKQQLGFEPKWYIQDGLKQTWEWFTSLSDEELNTQTSDS